MARIAPGSVLSSAVSVTAWIIVPCTTVLPGFTITSARVTGAGLAPARTKASSSFRRAASRLFLSVGPCPHPGKRDHGRRDAFGPRFRFGDAAALQVRRAATPPLVRPEVRRRRGGSAARLRGPCAAGRARGRVRSIAARARVAPRSRRSAGRDLRCQISDGLLCPAIRCLDGPRAQVFEFRAQRREAFHQRQFRRGGAVSAGGGGAGSTTGMGARSPKPDPVVWNSSGAAVGRGASGDGCKAAQASPPTATIPATPRIAVSGDGRVRRPLLVARRFKGREARGQVFSVLAHDVGPPIS